MLVDDHVDVLTKVIHIFTFWLLFSVRVFVKSMHETPACSIHQRSPINIIAPCDQFQRIQISAEQRLWLLKTIRHYSRLFATIRHYSLLFALFALFAIRYSHCSYYSLFALFVLFAIRDNSLFAVRYSLFATIRYSLFATIRRSLFATIRYSLFAIRVFQTPKNFILGWATDNC